MGLAYNRDIASIFFNEEMTRREKIGHILEKCQWKDLTVEEMLGVRGLFDWAGCPAPSYLNIWWCPINRIAKVSFEKRDYYTRGGMGWFNALRETAQTQRTMLVLSDNNLSYWLVHFPHKVENKSVEDKKPVPDVEKAVQIVEEEEEVSEPVSAPEEIQKPAEPIKPKVVRNIRRKKQEEVVVPPVYEDDDSPF